MLKTDELKDQKSCLNKARPDERLFVLLERDPAAPDVIRYWVRKRIWLGRNKPGDPQIIEALDCAMMMEHAQEHERDTAAGTHDPAMCWHCLNEPQTKLAKGGLG